MPLPQVNSIMRPPNPNPLNNALNNHPPVTANNSEHRAKMGHAAWNGNTFTVSGNGNVNYWFIPAIQDRVSYCVVPCGVGGDAYVISDQYGGCEYHELYNANQNLLAFLHVYRGGGATTQYTPAANWVLRSVKRSAVIANAHGMTGSNWSFSKITRGANPPVVQTEFIHVGGYPNLTVQGIDNGDTPYQTSSGVGTLLWVLGVLAGTAMVGLGLYSQFSGSSR